MKHRRIQTLVTAGLALILAVTPVLADGTFLQFREPSPAKSQASLEAWVVDVDVTPFTSHADAVYVDLDGLRYRIGLSDLEERAEGDLLWRGRFADGGQAVLTLENGLLVGILYSPQGVYELTTSPRGQVLQKIDPAGFEPCYHEAHDIESQTVRGAGFSSSDDSDKQALAADADQDAPGASATGSLSAKGLLTLDVMIVYTPQARSGAGGTAAIQALAQNAVDVSNTAFINSQTNARFNLVQTAEVAYNDSGNIETDRNWVRSNSTVKGWRDQFDIDLVSLLVENGGGYCGIAYLLGNESAVAFDPYAYQVTARSCAVGNLSYPHEHGHNLGLQHNPENGASTSQAYRTYAYGHYHNGNYRTVMSYSNPCSSGCPREPYFSNPNIVFQGASTGIANSRDNVRVLNEVAPITANYRTPCTAAPARPAYITGPNNDLCQGATETYQTPAVPDTDTYRWEVVGQPFVRTTTTNQVSISGHYFAPGAHTLRVRAQNGCGNSAWRSATIFVLSNSDPACGGCSGRFCF